MKLKKKYRGLEEGTEFVYVEKLDAWCWEIIAEDISDSGVQTRKSRVQFSDSFVKNNSEIFDIGVDEIENEEEDLIEKYEDLLEKIQKELNELKKGK